MGGRPTLYKRLSGAGVWEEERGEGLGSMNNTGKKNRSATLKITPAARNGFHIKGKRARCFTSKRTVNHAFHPQRVPEGKNEPLSGHRKTVGSPMSDLRKKPRTILSDQTGWGSALEKKKGFETT